MMGGAESNAATYELETKVVTKSMELRKYPFSHMFLPGASFRFAPSNVHMRFGAQLPEDRGAIYEIMHGIDPVKPDVYYMLSNTVVTHWATVPDGLTDDLILRLASVCWVALLPLKNYIKRRQDPYVPPVTIGWRRNPRYNTQIEGGVPNPNCFTNKPTLVALRVTFKKQKGSLLEREVGMLQVASAIHLAAFEATEDTDKPDWVTTPILLGNFKIDKRRHTTAATWLVFPPRAESVKAALVEQLGDGMQVMEIVEETGY